jgi:energy-coupling factor transporter ATP-binding protein EcfA2
MLSAGEKQRLAFARLFIHRPDIIVLDEATGALDFQSEYELMELLSKELEHATIVSVGHRSELEAFHGRKLVLQRGRRGAKLVNDDYFIPMAVLPKGPSGSRSAHTSNQGRRRTDGSVAYITWRRSPAASPRPAAMAASPSKSTIVPG